MDYELREQTIVVVNELLVLGVNSRTLPSQFGRRELYLYGLAAMTVVLLGVGGTGFSHASGSSWAAGSLVIFYSFLYQFTVSL